MLPGRWRHGRSRAGSARHRQRQIKRSAPPPPIRYILDELSFALPVTSTLHCLVAMEANPPGSTVLEGKSGELCRVMARV